MLPIPKDEGLKDKIARDMRDKMLNRANLRNEISEIFINNI